MTAKQPSIAQLVTQALRGAGKPLTIDEIRARIEMMRPIETRDPRATVRNALASVAQAASLGGRPVHYTWWPRHLADNAFRVRLADSDLETGTLVLSAEAETAVWSRFYGAPLSTAGQVTVALENGPTLQAEISHLVRGQAVWGLAARPDLAAWYRQTEVTPDDELIVRVLDVEAGRYALSPVRRAERDEGAIAARNQALADAAEDVLRASAPYVAYFDLIPRLIARDAYRHPLPPDPWEDVLRADLRFVLHHTAANLSERLVNEVERHVDIPPDIRGFPRPAGDRRKARSEEQRRAWADYLFDRGMDHRWAGWSEEAEAYYKEALRLDPGHSDAWVHVGNIRLDEDRPAEALALYRRAEAAALERTIGDPERYPRPFWLDLDSRPYMRALNGQGLSLWRMGQPTEAREVFARMYELNPNDNQGVRFLLADLDEGLSWEESLKRDEERFPQ